MSSENMVAKGDFFQLYFELFWKEEGNCLDGTCKSTISILKCSNKILPMVIIEGKRKKE